MIALHLLLLVDRTRSSHLTNEMCRTTPPSKYPLWGSFHTSPERISGTEMIPSPPMRCDAQFATQHFVHYAARRRLAMPAREHSRGAVTGPVMVCDRRCCAGCRGTMSSVGCPLYSASTTVVAAGQVVTGGCRNRNHHHRPSALLVPPPRSAPAPTLVFSQNGRQRAAQDGAGRCVTIRAANHAKHALENASQIDHNALSRDGSRYGLPRNGTGQAQAYLPMRG
jgi:hypothetical protein